MVMRDSENCHLNLSLSAVCDCGSSCLYFLTIFDVSIVGSMIQHFLEESVTKLCHEAVAMLCPFFTMLWVGLQCVIVAVPGCTHLLLKLTFSIQFLKVVQQEQQNFL